MVRWWGVCGVYNDATSYDCYNPFIYFCDVSIVHEKISDLPDHHMLMPSTEEKKGNISQHHKAMFYDTQKEMIALTPSK